MGPLRIPYGTLEYGCVLRPLGSPSGGLKLSYVHVPGVTATGRPVRRGDGQRQYGPRYGYMGGYTGWVIPGCTTDPAALPEESAIPSEAGP